MKNNIKLYLEPYRENLYIFQKRYGTKIRVTQVKFGDFLDLFPSNLVATGKWAKTRADEFLETIYQKGITHEAQAKKNPEAYETFDEMYQVYPDFEGWSYEIAQKIKQLIEACLGDKQNDPMWYVPKSIRFPWLS